nr:helix-turn-helix domain-containing protein [Specibacter cremeus]
MSLIRSARRTLGWTQEQLARRLGVGTTSVSTLEINEERGTAKINSVDKALEAMGKMRVTFVIDKIPDHDLAAIRSRAHEDAAKIAWTMALESQALTDEARARLEDRAFARLLLEA